MNILDRAHTHHGHRGSDVKITGYNVGAVKMFAASHLSDITVSVSETLMRKVGAR